MQKKLIALAVAGLVSAPVFAQSNVTIYGLVDMGVSYRGDNIDNDVGSKTAIDSGMASGSRLGFRGVEDLGNGLKAGFVLEQGINVDRGTSAQGGRSYGRQSYLSLGGGFGTVILGRINSPQKNLQDAFDPFGGGTVGQMTNIYTQTSARFDNTAAYVTPNFGGLTVTAAYSTQVVGQENPDNTGDLRGWAIMPRYTNGPLDVGLNYHRVKLHGVSGAEANKVWDLAAAYDFGAVKLAAMFGQNKDNGLWDKATFWMVGATVPVGAAGKVLVSYNRAKAEDVGVANDDARSSQWALGYTHALSKRTDVYAAYADINNKDEDVIVATSADGSNAGEGYQRGFNLGIRHRF